MTNSLVAGTVSPLRELCSGRSCLAQTSDNKKKMAAKAAITGDVGETVEVQAEAAEV